MDLFKIGLTYKLKARLSSMNTYRTPNDSFYFSYIKCVYNPRKYLT